jgi:hypothetical protein
MGRGYSSAISGKSKLMHSRSGSGWWPPPAQSDHPRSALVAFERSRLALAPLISSRRK